LKNMKKFWIRITSICLLTLGGIGQAANHEVRIEDFAFNPSSVTIKVGDTVTWRQIDFIQHTSTSGQNGRPDGRWNSPFLNAGQTFVRTFNEAGTFPYFCLPHPEMTGRVIVEQATANPPTVAITSPTNTAVLTPGSVTIVAEAQVAGSTITMIEFFNGTQFLGMVHGAPWSVTVNLEAGTHTLTAKATAANGQTATSTAVTVTVGIPATPITDPFPAIARSDLTVELEPVATGLVAPLGLVTPNDGSGRLFIFDQIGLVHVLANGALLPEPLLDARPHMVGLSRNYDERGLLGMALHPNFNQNGLLYTYTSEPNGPMADFMIMGAQTNNHQSVLAEWKIDPAHSNRVDAASRREIMRIDQPQFNHNGGAIHFGPDGMLYLAIGDGGAADDEGFGHSPGGNGQDLQNVLGKMLRIDVNTRTAANGKYGVPSDNPFVERAGLDEIYAYGFRNPYTWSFDRLTGEMYVADVGQNQIEEVNRVFRGGNYGWPIKEGTFFFHQNGTNAGFIATTPAVANVPPDLIDPIAEYDHSEGLSIIGGYVYRGSRIPGLIGKYVTGDFGTFNSPAGRLFYLDRNNFRELRIGATNRALGLWIKGFGQDAQGELFVLGSGALGPNGTSGQVLKIVPATNDMRVTSMTAQSTNVVVAFEGGVGPFVLEGRQSLDAGPWHTLGASAARTMTNPATGSSGFLRVADLAGNAALGFSVSLSGLAERPTPVTNTAGTGLGTLSLEGNTLHFDIRYSGLSAPASAAHIHGPASAATAAGVLIDLAPYNGGGFGTSGVLAGSVTLTAEQKALVLAGRTYVNIHTANNQSGEIRGQIAPLVYVAAMNGASERPNPAATPGRGSAILLLVGDKLTINADYRGLLSTATAAHIHGSANTEAAAGVMVDLAPHNGGAWGQTGTFSGTLTLSPNQIAALVDGLTYLNVHTTNYPGGEIRGQIFPASAAIGLSSTLTGAAERPNPVQTAATGSASYALQGNTLHFNIRYSGMTAPANAAHIHGPSTAGEAAGVLIDLAPFNGGAFGTNGTLIGSVMLTEQQRAWVLQGRTYVNIHSTFSQPGEIRGQIAPVVMHVEMLGASERPNSVLTAGRGRGTLMLVRDQLTLGATYSGLPVVATAAHIHGPANPANPAGVLRDLGPINSGGFGQSGSFSGTVSLEAGHLAALLDELTYLNIHTSNNPGGEIRGQIVR
jgi:glucose/arabinose dehydrogenase/plastocyanin